MSEREVDDDQVQREHLETVNVPAHWGYLFLVLGGGTALMLAFVALLGGGS